MKHFFSLILLCLLITTSLSAQDGELGDESWTVKTRLGRVFYLTHGTNVWGHEFGFFKNMNNCESDTFWLTFSSSEEKVKDFIGKKVEILLDVDGVNFRIKLPMLTADTLAFTHIMMFTNLSLDKQLLDALTKGRYVRVQILEPKELEAFLDIKYDQFSLEGFVASRKEAGIVCRDNLPSKGIVEGKK